MKNFISRKSFMLSLLAMLMSVSLFAQDKPQRQSPAATAEGTIHGAAITIKYSSPAVKGRKIWGDLVPFDKVWRAGANEATIFETSKAIKVEGKTLPAGKYSLYLTPGENEWKVIFNSQTGQWGINRDGSTTDDATKDVLVVTVKPKKSVTMEERLVYRITKTGFEMAWDNLVVPVTIK